MNAARRNRGPAVAAGIIALVAGATGVASARPEVPLPAVTAPTSAEIAAVKATTLSRTTVRVADARRRNCSAAIATGRAGVDTVNVRMPAVGVVAAKLAGARGDWDVAVFEADSKRLVAGSSAFRANELATGWAAKGEDLVVQACRRKGASRSAKLAVTSLALPTGKATGPAPAAQLLKVFVPSKAAINRLQALGLDVTEHAGRNYVEVVSYGPRDLGVIEATGYRTEVVVADLLAQERARAIADQRFTASRAGGRAGVPSGRTSYRRLPEYQADLKKLAEQNPGLVKPITLAYKTNEGRDVTGVEISRDVNAKDGKPVFFIMGAHHAREWPSAEHAMEFATDLVNSVKAGDKRITGLLDRARVIAVPIINVDGFNVSREGAELLGQDTDLYEDLKDNESGLGPTATYLADPFSAYRRRNCRLFSTPPREPGAQPDAAPAPPGACMLPMFRTIGTDPNRNYGSLWGGPGASALPAYDTYRGSGPFSEPETQNVRDLVSKRQVTMLITNHTFSNLVLRPPGVKAQGLSPDEEGLKELGDRMAAQNGYTSQPSWALYDTTGGTEDWSFLQTGAFGYTFEIGEDTFHPAFADVAQHYERGAKSRDAGAPEGGNREAYLIALEHTADAAKHSVIEGKAPAGTVLRLRKKFQTSTSPVRPFESDLVADPFGVQTTETPAQQFTDTLDTSMVVGPGKKFTWHVNPSTRPAVQSRRYRDDVETVVKAFANRPPVGAEAFAAPAEGAEVTNEVQPTGAGAWDRELTLTQAQVDAMDSLSVRLDWKTAAGATSPEDYDLEIYRGDIKVGTSGNTPGEPEATTVEKPALVAGTYRFRVVNFAAAGQSWDLTLSSVAPGPVRTEPGTGSEAWTFSCETADGKELFKTDVVVDRGGSWSLPAQACGAVPAGVAPKPQGLKVASTSLGRALRNGLPVSFRPTEAATAKVALLRGTKTVGAKRLAVAAGKATTVRVGFSKAARSSLSKANRAVLKVRVALVDAAGDRSVTTRKVVLRRK